MVCNADLVLLTFNRGIPLVDDESRGGRCWLDLLLRAHYSVGGGVVVSGGVLNSLPGLSWGIDLVVVGRGLVAGLALRILPARLEHVTECLLLL